MAKIAFIGLGVMGAPMAGHLAKAGHDVAVYNRSEDKARDWAQKHKGRTYTSVANAVDGADVVFACVGNDRDVREVFEAASTKMRKGALFVDHTTSSAVLARELSERCEALGLGFLDAPVSGGQADALPGLAQLHDLLGDLQHAPGIEARGTGRERAGPDLDDDSLFLCLHRARL